MSADFWQKFFSAASIPPDDAQHYAVIFEDNRITESMLGDLRKDHLTDMGIRRMGDIISILKCANSWSTTTTNSSQQQSRLQKLPVEQPQQQRAEPQLMPAVVPSAASQQLSARLAESINDVSPNVGPALHGRVVATGDGSRRFTVAPEVEQTTSAVVATKRKIDDRFKAAVTAAAVGAASVRLKEAVTETGRAVFSRLGELSSLSSRAVAVGSSSSALKSSSTNLNASSASGGGDAVSAASSSVFNRLGGSQNSKSLSLTVGTSGRKVLAAPSTSTAAEGSAALEKVAPTIVRPIRFDLPDDDNDDYDDDDEDEPEPDAIDRDRADYDDQPLTDKMTVKVVDKWPSNQSSRQEQQQHQSRSSHQPSSTSLSSLSNRRQQRSREGSGFGPLTYRGVLKLPTSGSASASMGVKKVEAHSTVDELGPTLYSDSIAYSSSSATRHHRDHRDSRDVRRSDGESYSSAVKRRSDGERIGHSSSSTSASSKFARIVINKSVR